MFVRSLLSIGIALGLAASSAPALSQTPAKPAAVWQLSEIPWTTLPDGLVLGPAPQGVSVPAQQYAYGVRSAPVQVFAAREPVILRLTVGDVAGMVGALIVTADGSTPVSKESLLKTDADNDLYFRLRPGMPAAMFVLRNYNAEGTSGSATIRSVRFLREAELDNDELTAIAAAGLH
jgi:hypothetical protein